MRETCNQCGQSLPEVRLKPGDMVEYSLWPGTIIELARACRETRFGIIPAQTVVDAMTMRYGMAPTGPTRTNIIGLDGTFLRRELAAVALVHGHIHIDRSK